MSRQGYQIRYVGNITAPFLEDDNLFIHELIAAVQLEGVAPKGVWNVRDAMPQGGKVILETICSVRFDSASERRN